LCTDLPKILRQLQAFYAAKNLGIAEGKSDKHTQQELDDLEVLVWCGTCTANSSGAIRDQAATCFNKHPYFHFINDQAKESSEVRVAAETHLATATGQQEEHQLQLQGNSIQTSTPTKGTRKSSGSAPSTPGEVSQNLMCVFPCLDNMTHSQFFLQNTHSHSKKSTMASEAAEVQVTSPAAKRRHKSRDKSAHEDSVGTNKWPQPPKKGDSAAISAWAKNYKERLTHVLSKLLLNRHVIHTKPVLLFSLPP
jgi:hypothetical protein